MDYIWAGMVIFSIITGAVTGRMQAVSDAVFSGAGNAVTLCLTILGAMCLWGGLMRVADKSGITAVLGRILRPFIKLAFPGMDTRGPAAKAISMNISANLLGLGNAATPFGLEAMKELQKNNKESPGMASGHMVTFVVINTASLQILPTTVAMMRSKYGAASPMDIMPAVWLSSVAALVAGLIVALVFNKFGMRSSECGIKSVDLQKNNSEFRIPNSEF